MYVSMVQNSIMKISKYGLNNKGQNGLIPLFEKIYKYIRIYYYLRIQVHETRIYQKP